MVDAPSPEKPAPDSPEVLARVAEGLAFAETAARQMKRQCGGYAQLDDLRSAGREALLIAARSWDPERGMTFPIWAHLRMRGAMIDSLRTSTNIPRRVYRKLRALQDAAYVHEIAAEERAASPAVLSAEQADAKITDELGTAAMAMALAFLRVGTNETLAHAVDPRATPEEAVGNEELRARIREAMATLPDAERRLIQHYYFEDGRFEEVATELGLSRSWASRLHTRGIEAIADAIRRKNLAAETD